MYIQYCNQIQVFFGNASIKAKKKIQIIRKYFIDMCVMVVGRKSKR